MPFSDEQLKRLVAPLDAKRISTRRKQGMELSYLEAHDVIDQANAVFGFHAWSYRVTKLDFLAGAWVATVLLEVRTPDGDTATREDVGVGIPAAPRDADHASPDAHETAIKGAATDALKRALRTYGNAFGNSLYDKDDKLGAGADQGGRPQEQPARPATAAPTKAAAIGPERGAKLEGLVQKALIDQGASVAYAYDWLDGALRRLQKHHISDLTATEGQALLERAARADVTQPPGGATPGPSAMDVRPGPDGTWDSLAPDDPACPTCGGPMVHKEGTNKAGKPFAGYFCADRNCGQKPLWDAK